MYGESCVNTNCAASPSSLGNIWFSFSSSSQRYRFAIVSNCAIQVAHCCFPENDGSFTGSGFGPIDGEYSFSKGYAKYCGRLVSLQSGQCPSLDQPVVDHA
ncbi:hypothetical protein DPMN_168049 [Dreissena polymorpha]|uniref:Uncharacterized protein n=1 Tax=Dreissena polymorpha TaxID=45954 RepID=A0A9D4IWV9_DREPO|nr:hypothetical protein DPMN_168049 [Dreissena polymorpha]